ncbi:hypothetical protein C8R44DRAFT_748580 [Mycena epipterygia]|nr:hypothetical protein C8R44DRAFT_748580 [Mycena epipterygia]
MLVKDSPEDPIIDHPQTPSNRSTIAASTLEEVQAGSATAHGNDGEHMDPPSGSSNNQQHLDLVQRQLWFLVLMRPLPCITVRTMPGRRPERRVLNVEAQMEAEKARLVSDGSQMGGEKPRSIAREWEGFSHHSLKDQGHDTKAQGRPKFGPEQLLNTSQHKVDDQFIVGKKILAPHFRMVLGPHHIKSATSVNLLGVHIDCELQWKEKGATAWPRARHGSRKWPA